MGFWNKNKSSNGLRVIKTARDKDSINKGVKDGFKPLLKKVEPSSKIRSKYCVVQDKQTGEIEIVGDYRSHFPSDEFEVLIDWTYYYPYSFKSPFAAYLIPKDISIGERVYLEDLIEDYVGASWNQGDTYRLENCEAIWNGSDFEIQYDTDISSSTFVG